MQKCFILIIHSAIEAHKIFQANPKLKTNITVSVHCNWCKHTCDENKLDFKLSSLCMV